MKHYLIALLSCSLLSACSTTVSESLQRVSDPDIPTNIRLFVGQDLGSVGGLEKYNQGYVDYFGVPAGVTIYTSLESLEGLTSKVNYGAGDSMPTFISLHLPLTMSTLQWGLTLSINSIK